MHEVDFSHEHIETAAERAAIARIDLGPGQRRLHDGRHRYRQLDLASAVRQGRLAAPVAGLSSRFVVDRPRNRVALADPADAVPAGRHHRRGRNSATSSRRCYRDAGLTQSEIDTGAVILTGEAIKRKNARAIDELFAADAGKFVCATAGHKLECRLAAHGSGAVALSKARDTCLLHVDIGGGTTKLALIDRGTILGLCGLRRRRPADRDRRRRRVEPHRRFGAACRRRFADRDFAAGAGRCIGAPARSRTGSPRWRPT